MCVCVPVGHQRRRWVVVPRCKRVWGVRGSSFLTAVCACAYPQGTKKKKGGGAKAAQADAAPGPSGNGNTAAPRGAAAGPAGHINGAGGAAAAAGGAAGAGVEDWQQIAVPPKKVLAARPDACEITEVRDRGFEGPGFRGASISEASVAKCEQRIDHRRLAGWLACWLVPAAGLEEHASCPCSGTRPKIYFLEK